MHSGANSAARNREQQEVTENESAAFFIRNFCRLLATALGSIPPSLADSPLGEGGCKISMRLFCILIIKNRISSLPNTQSGIYVVSPFFFYSLSIMPDPSAAELSPLRLLYWNCRGAISKNPDIEALAESAEIIILAETCVS